jgi:hypothetical protein
MLQELHGGIVGGHFFFDIIMRKILDVGYWLLTIIPNVHEYYKSCDQCRQTCNLLTKNLTKLVITLLEKPFQKWGLDFIGLIKLARNLSKLHTWRHKKDYKTSMCHDATNKTMPNDNNK